MAKGVLKKMKQQPDRCAKKVTGLSEAGKCTSERSLWSLGKEKQRSFFSAVVHRGFQQETCIKAGLLTKHTQGNSVYNGKPDAHREARNDSTSQFLNTARLNFQDYQHVRWLKPRNTDFAKKEGVQGNLAHCSTWEHKDRRKEEGKKNGKNSKQEEWDHNTFMFVFTSIMHGCLSKHKA